MQDAFTVTFRAAHPANPLELILGDIERAIEAKIWYAALAVSLSLPDVCSLLELPAEQSWSKDWKYAGWFDRNLPNYLPLFSGQDCYRLRGGILHNAKIRKDESRWDYIALTTSDSPMRMHLCVSRNNGGTKESALTLDIEIFCQDIVAATRKWYEQKSADENVKSNLPYVISARGSFGNQISGLGFIG